MEESAGGSGPIACPRLREDVIGHAFLFRWGGEALRLQIEHRPVAPVELHQFVVRAELNHASMFKDADAVRVTDGRKSMRDQDGRAVPRRCQQAVENLCFATNVEL